MPPPDDGNEYLSFVDLIKLEKLNEFTYQSVALPFSPGGRLRPSKPRSYGGHVYAQAAWAACQTVKDGLLIYNAVGSFHLPGEIDFPFIYTVQTVRDGRSFSTRIVHVTQGDSKDICFSGIFSFKIAETTHLDVQERIDLWQQYKIVLGNNRPDEFIESPGMDAPWYNARREKTGYNDEFPGLQCTQPDMTAYNKDKHPLDRRTLLFYRTLGELPPDSNLHRCAHLYESDRNSLFHTCNHMDVGDIFTQMSTLVHTTVFHSSSEELMFGPSCSETSPMDDTSDKGRWFAHEDWFTRTSHGRALYEGRLSAPDGTHVATVIQDGLLRYTKQAQATDDEIAVLRETEKGWKPRQKL